ncbi:MAG: aminotransferase class III-fold pyridoxal phosphate-dependent enzyme [Candidatus Binatia bacterium]|nr:aminotransferase class III-fold pyridoxal phosphate-dependent enzyme [Candidatus Binatia bacterium]
MSDAITLTDAEIPSLLDRLVAAGRTAAALPREERVSILGRVAAGWLADRPALQETADAISAETGYAPAMVVTCLERTLEAWSTRPLRALLDQTLASPASIATAPELVVAVLAQNTPGLAIAPTFSALALGSAILLKSSHGEETFAPRLAERIRAVDATLGAACEAHTWRGGTSLEKTLFPRASRVVVYGPRDAVERARSLAPETVLSCGPRVSVAVVAQVSDIDALAVALARDVAFLDQRGCLSPQAVLVAEELDRTALGHALARELSALEKTWPRRKLSEADAASFRRAVEQAEARALGGADIELLGGVGEPWAVVVDPQPSIEASPLDRFVRLHPFSGSEGLATALAPLRGLLDCVGLTDGGRPLDDICRSAGAGRICPIGKMQDPPADWHSGGRPPLHDYLTWSARPTTDAHGSLGTKRRGRFLRHVAQTSDSPRGIDVERARGSWVHSRDGRRHLDLLAGIGVASIGHGHPRVAAAVAEQSARYTHVMVYGEDILAPQVDLAERLAAMLPPSLSTTYFTNSGAEAIEGAMKLVRKATGRKEILAFEGAYHGDTTGAMALGGNPFYREPFEPLVGPVEHLPWNDDRALSRIDERTAAVFTEPVQAEGGVRIPSPEFLPALARRCREVGALLVFDEVVTGLGRTGTWFGFEHWAGSAPDVMVLAKSLGGGLPLGAFVSSPELHRALSEDPPLGHVTTFGGNPVCCAAALASLDVLTEERLPERAGTVGLYFKDRLSELVGHGVQEVRGIGLLIGLEFETPNGTMAFADGCRENGVLLGWTLHHDCVIRLAPPLTISEDEIDHALSVMKRVL